MSIILNERGSITPITAVRPKTRQAFLAIFKSPNGESDWEVVMPANVPAWLKTDDCLRRLVAGEMAQSGEGDWYRAEEQVQH